MLLALSMPQDRHTHWTKNIPSKAIMVVVPVKCKNFKEPTQCSSSKEKLNKETGVQSMSQSVCPTAAESCHANVKGMLNIVLGTHITTQLTETR